MIMFVVVVIDVASIASAACDRHSILNLRQHFCVPFLRLAKLASLTCVARFAVIALVGVTGSPPSQAHALQ